MSGFAAAALFSTYHPKRTLMQLIGNKRIWYGLTLLVLDAIIFGMTNAAKVPSIMMIISFVMLIITIYSLVYLLMNIVSIYGWHLKRKRQVALYLTLLVGGLLALQSINELTRRDIVVWLPLIVIGCLYSSFLRANKRNLES